MASSRSNAFEGHRPPAASSYLATCGYTIHDMANLAPTAAQVK
jgi:hypothetical protein